MTTLQEGYRIRGNEFISKDDMLAKLHEVLLGIAEEPPSDEEAVFFDSNGLARETASRVEREFQLDEGALTSLTLGVVYEYLRTQIREHIGRVSDAEDDLDINGYVTQMNNYVQPFMDKSLYDVSVVEKLERSSRARLVTLREMVNRLNPEYLESRWILAYCSVILKSYVEHRYQTLIRFANAMNVTVPPEEN